MKIKRLSTRRLIDFAGSELFWRLIVGLLVAQALWIALSGRYPMAFDEDFHLGLIRLYADHISPFWSAHPSAGDAFGPLTRDPSYLYHWLMSFPYNLIKLFTSSEMWQVIFLRLLNVGMFAYGFALYRRLLLKTGASRALVHLAVLIVALIPVTPLLAAQINYDNLIMPLTALSLLLALRFEGSLQARRMDVRSLFLLLVTSLFASVVKYAFLPVFLAITVYLLIRLYMRYKTPRPLLKSFAGGWSQLSGPAKWWLVIPLVLILGLFAERHILNVVRYHTPAPDCAQVLDYEHCKAYGPWIRDYNLEASKQPDAGGSPVLFSRYWLHGMWFRSFFAVDGPSTGFQTRSPLTVPGFGAVAFGIIGLGALIAAGRQVWRRYDASVLWLFVTVSVIYTAVLWLQQYSMFLQTGKAVAINGRYILPVLPLITVILALGVNEVLKSQAKLKAAFAAIFIVCLLWGGGAMTYILRSNPDWYWPSTPLKGTNLWLQRNFGPLTPGYDHPNQYWPST